MSGAIRVTPSPSGRGLTLAIAPAWGRTGSATERLGSAHDARGLGAGNEFEADSRLAFDAGYGFGLPGNRGVLTPYAGLELGDAGSRTVRTGARWQVGPDAVLGLEGTRQTSDSRRGRRPADAASGAGLLTARRAERLGFRKSARRAPSLARSSRHVLTERGGVPGPAFARKRFSSASSAPQTPGSHAGCSLIHRAQAADSSLRRAEPACTAASCAFSARRGCATAGPATETGMCAIHTCSLRHPMSWPNKPSGCVGLLVAAGTGPPSRGSIAMVRLYSARCWCRHLVNPSSSSSYPGCLPTATHLVAQRTLLRSCRRFTVMAYDRRQTDQRY